MLVRRAKRLALVAHGASTRICDKISLLGSHSIDVDAVEEMLDTVVSKNLVVEKIDGLLHHGEAPQPFVEALEFLLRGAVAALGGSGQPPMQ